MRIHYVLLLCCLLATASSSTSHAESALHTFTTPDGRSLNAVIKDYNGSTGKIQIEREDGKRLWILATVFSEPDQEYIQQWITADQFMSPAKFKITGKKTENETSKHTIRIEYEITLENKMDHPVKDLKIKYRAYILGQGYEGFRDSSRVDGEELHIAEIPAGGEVSRKLQAIILTTKYRTVTEVSGWSNSSDVYEKKTNKEQLKGFWVKVYGPKVDGVPVIRDWCNPSDTNEDFEWQNITPKRSAKINELKKHNNSDPAHTIERLKEAYEKNPKPRTAQQLGHTYIWRLKPPNIPLGLEWFEKAANEGNKDKVAAVAACRGLALVYSSFYGHTDYYSLEKTLEYGQKALSIEPECYTSHQAIAKAYAVDGQFEKAVEHQTKAIEFYKYAIKAKSDPKLVEYISTMEAILELFRNGKL